MTDEQIGDRLRALRRAAGLTTAQVAEALDVSTQNVSAWERGAYKPRTRAVARALDDVLRAQGEVLELLGYRAADEALTQRVEALEAQMVEVLERLRTLTRRLGRMRDDE